MTIKDHKYHHLSLLMHMHQTNFLMRNTFITILFFIFTMPISIINRTWPYVIYLVGYHYYWEYMIMLCRRKCMMIYTIITNDIHANHNDINDNHNDINDNHQ